MRRHQLDIAGPHSADQIENDQRGEPEQDPHQAIGQLGSESMIEESGDEERECQGIVNLELPDVRDGRDQGGGTGR